MNSLEPTAELGFTIYQDTFEYPKKGEKVMNNKTGGAAFPIIFVDGDFKTGQGDCEYHCSPTCHPAQVGPEWKYGCLHPDWPQNKAKDFCPIVNCGGLKEKCELRAKGE